MLSMLHEGHGRNIYIVFMYLKHIPASCFYDALTRSNRRSKRGWKLTRSETYVLLRVFLPSPYRLSFLSVLFPQRERWRRRWVRAAQRGGGRCHRIEARRTEEHRSRLLPGLRERRVFFPARQSRSVGLPKAGVAFLTRRLCNLWLGRKSPTIASYTEGGEW